MEDESEVKPQTNLPYEPTGIYIDAGRLGSILGIAMLFVAVLGLDWLIHLVGKGAV